MDAVAATHDNGNVCDKFLQKSRMWPLSETRLRAIIIQPESLVDITNLLKATQKQTNGQTQKRWASADLGWSVHKVHLSVVSVFFIWEIEREDIVNSQLICTRKCTFIHSASLRFTVRCLGPSNTRKCGKNLALTKACKQPKVCL